MKDIIEFYKKYWAFLFVGGAVLGYVSEALGILQLEIHYRLFLIIGLSIASLGGYLLAAVPPIAGVIICFVVLSAWHLKERQSKQN